MTLVIGKPRPSFKYTTSFKEGWGKKALSLIELLVAITILSVGIVTALQALSLSSRVAGLSFKMTKAILLTEDKMQEEEFKEKQGLSNAEE